MQVLQDKNSWGVAIKTVALLLVACLCQAQDDTVKVEGGKISGTSKDGIRNYKGIPFAFPPVGDLRWKPPQPAKAWEDTRKCDKFGPSCPQPKQLVFSGVGENQTSEDCLYLNVWTPAKKPDEKLAVMVWIHGGGYTTGAGSMPTYDGTNFAKQGVVLVTINYRLGPFGFLSHPLLSKESEKGVSGNFGLLDMICALQWVKKNIAAFGGNPDCVTIFGESAGASAVTALMVCPLAKGLFQRVISESGVAAGFPTLNAAESSGARIAKKLACETLEDLRKKSADEILEAANPAQGLFGKYEDSSRNKFGPNIDGWLITDEPAKLYEAGKFHGVSFMAGSNADEGNIFLKQLRLRTSKDYERLVKGIFGKDSEEVLQMFPASDDEVENAANKLVSMQAFNAPARAAARYVPGSYLYHFTKVPPEARFLKLGAYHAAEIPYVFGNLSTKFRYPQNDKSLSKTMIAAWVQFAKTGDPNGGDLPKWPKYSAESDECLEFGEQTRVVKGLLKEECDLLDRIRSQRK